MPPATMGRRPRAEMPCDGLARQPGIFTGGEKLVGIHDVDEVVGNAAPLLRRQLGGSDIEVAVDLERIAVDHFAVERFGNGQRQVAFSGAGGTGHCNQRALRRIRTNDIGWIGAFPAVCASTPLYNDKVIFDEGRGSATVERK